MILGIILIIIGTVIFLFVGLPIFVVTLVADDEWSFSSLAVMLLAFVLMIVGGVILDHVTGSNVQSCMCEMEDE